MKGWILETRWMSRLLGLLGLYVKKSDIVDNLTSTTTNAPLSANMGKTLNDNLTRLKPTKTLFRTLFDASSETTLDLGFTPTNNSGANILVFNANIGVFSCIRFEYAATNKMDLGVSQLQSVSRNGSNLTINFPSRPWGTTVFLMFTT